MCTIYVYHLCIPFPYRMDLLYQPKSDIVKSLFQISPVSEEKDAKPEDKQSDVYKVNGVDAHGKYQ